MPFAKHRILYPSEWVPLPLLFLKKYRSESGLKPWSSKGFNIEPFKYWRIPLKNAAFQWSRLPVKYMKEKADLVHAHFLFPDGLLALQLWEASRTPYIITLRSSGLQLMKHCRPSSSTYQLGLEALKNAAAVTVLNHAGKIFLEEVGIESIHLIPHGLANSDYISTSSIEEKKHRPGICISTIGNQLVTKNIDWVVDYVRKSPIALDLDVIGPVDIGHKDLDVRHFGTKIQFHGRISRDKVLELLRKSDIFALPSSRESFGLSYLEAAANYNAIIGFKGQGPIGIFDQEEMMFPADRSMFKQCLEKVINDEKLRMAMAQKAYSKAQKLTWNKITEMYENLYKEALL
ncbi:MAG TPA: glycosyltransferase family 4 protein [Saprospiraceae bacterium]|nr:glycosyltransferase family 4 protein [Saprospiraceae bacterium]